MSGIRRITAFLLCVCLLMTLAPSAAFAASDERKTRPTIKINNKETMRPGVEMEITLTCGKPGFLTARITDGEGAEVAVLCEEAEVSTGQTVLTWDGVLENGENAVTGGKYNLNLFIRDEWGNEIKSEVVSALKIGEARPSVSDVSFTYNEKDKKWIITGTASMKGYVVVDLHTAKNLDDRYLVVANGYEKSQKDAQIKSADQQFTLEWNGKLAEEEDGKMQYYPLDPGYYALSVYLDDASNVRSEKEIIYVSVGGDKDRTPYLTGEEPEGFSTKEETQPAAVKADSSAKADDKVDKDASDDKDEDADSDDADEDVSEPEETESAVAGPKESIKGEDGLTLGVVMGEEGLQIGAGVSDVAKQSESSFWTINANSSDEEIWAALTRTMTSVDEDERSSVSVLATPESKGRKIAQVNGLTQGLNVVGTVGDWSIVEVYRNEDSAFTRGYIRTSRLRTVEPDQEYGVTIDKATQTLTVWHNGERIGSVPVSTGFASEKTPDRETPAGEFILATRMGTREMQMGFCEYTIRISGDVWIHEIPTTRRKGSDFSTMEDVLGEKATRGTIAVAHESSEDGAINMEWIWENLNRKRVKVLIFDDKERDAVPYLDPADYQ